MDHLARNRVAADRLDTWNGPRGLLRSLDAASELHKDHRLPGELKKEFWSMHRGQGDRG